MFVDPLLLRKIRDHHALGPSHGFNLMSHGLLEKVRLCSQNPFIDATFLGLVGFFGINWK